MADTGVRMSGRSARSGPLPLELLGKLALHGKGAAALGRELDLARSIGPVRYVRQARDGTGSQLAGAPRRALYRRIWDEAAAAVGAEVTEQPPGFLTISNGARSVRLWRHLVPIDDPVTLQLAGDKPAAHAVLTAAGLPVPAYRTLPLGALDEASQFAGEHGRVVVKPASSTGAGRGVTGGVRTRADLLRARIAAARHDSERILLERHAEGEEYRVLVLDGAPIGVVRREPPRLHGDGTSTVAGLVDAENARRRLAEGRAGLWSLHLDLDALIALRGQSLSVRSRPEAGRLVAIKSTTSEGSERDASVVGLDDPAVAGVVGDAARAATAIGAQLASVEMVTPDPARPLAEAGGVVVEVNTTPGIAQHYLVSNPDEIVPVAEAVLRHLVTA
jgi:D-alanine-D-alanine ligase-like ATP-grasp enzyme